MFKSFRNRKAGGAEDNAISMWKLGLYCAITAIVLSIAVCWLSKFMKDGKPILQKTSEVQQKSNESIQKQK